MIPQALAELPPEDAELARRIGQHDERAFEALMRRHNRMLYRLARSILAGGDAIAADKAATHTVVIDGVAYQPAALTVRRGDTVVWVNKDPLPHTVTAKGSFDSHDIAAGKSWKYTARKAGEYAYICTLHPNMKGTLKVE